MVWPSILTTSTNKDFWLNEWKRHGSRSGLGAEPYVYMITQATNGRDLSTMLNDAVIIANANTLYTRDRIENAIKQISGFHTFIKCDTNEGDTLVLTQIRICASYHEMGTAIAPYRRDCTRPSSTCGDMNQTANILLLPVS